MESTLLYVVLALCAVAFTITAVMDLKKKREYDKHILNVCNALNKELTLMRNNINYNNQAIKRLEAKLGNYRAEIVKVNANNQKSIDIYNQNLESIDRDLNKLFELLNKQPEENEEKKDNSSFAGILSGIISGVLTGIITDILKDSDKKDPKENKNSNSQNNSNECFVVRNKITQMPITIGTETECKQWLADLIAVNQGEGINPDDYEIVKIEPEESKSDQTEEDDQIKIRDI